VTPFPSPVAAYSLDGGPWVNVEMPLNGTSFVNTVSNFEFIGQTTFNEVGIHSLVITPLIPTAFFLDYIIVQSPTAFLPQQAEAASVPIPATTRSIQPAGPSTTNIASPSRTNLVHLNSGAVAAIVLGITLGCVLVSVAWYLLCRRRTIRERWRSEDEPRSGVCSSDRNYPDVN
jgi:hypothetical protein